MSEHGTSKGLFNCASCHHKRPTKGSRLKYLPLCEMKKKVCNGCAKDLSK